MFKTIVGQSECSDGGCAAYAAAQRCKQGLEGLEPKAGLLFVSGEFDSSQALRRVREVFPHVPLAGCSTSGDMSTDLGSSDDSVSLAMFASDKVDITTGVGRGMGQDPEAAATRAFEMASAGLDGPPALCLVFFRPGLGCPVKTLERLGRLLPEGCPVLGGMAGTMLTQISEPRAIHESGVFDDSISLMLFSGPLALAHGISNSWRPIGMRATATEVRDYTRLVRVNDMSALDYYRSMVGERSVPTAEIPLAVFDDDENFHIRANSGFDEDEGSITYGDGINEGDTIQLTEATRDGILDNTLTSVSDLVKTYPEGSAPALALAVSCGARKLILGTRVGEELENLKQALPEKTPVIGFYSYGELAPVPDTDRTMIHHCTLSTILLGEEGQALDVAPDIPREQCGQADTDDDRENRIITLERENSYLLKKLRRSEGYRSRMEQVKDSQDAMFRKLNRDMREAKGSIAHKNKLLKQALALAEQIQQRLLPQTAPTFAGYDIAGKSVYCDETGGDYFDYLTLPGPCGKRLDLVIGDVTGHGIAAALLMTTARALLRMRASQAGDISELVTDINNALTPDIYDSGMFMTLFYLSLNPHTRALRWVRAGHDPALIFDPGKNDFEELMGSGMPLGVFDEFNYEEFEKPDFNPGQVLVMGTDGIWETTNRRGKMFGKDRLKEIIRHNAGNSSRDILDTVLNDLGTFNNNMPFEDDVTMMVLKAEDMGGAGKVAQ